MNFLILDTTRQSAIIALCVNNNTTITEIPETKKYSESLLIEIDRILNNANITLSDVDVFGAVSGPGSFTGIRIAMATIKAFVCALDKKIVVDNVFNIVSNQVNNGTIILKNTNSSCYFAKFLKGNIEDSGVIENIEILNLNTENLYFLEIEQLDNLLSYKNIKPILDYSKILVEHFKNLIETNKFVDINDFSPYYLQLSQAEKELEEKSNDKKVN